MSRTFPLGMYFLFYFTPSYSIVPKIFPNVYERFQFVGMPVFLLIRNCFLFIAFLGGFFLNHGLVLEYFL